MVDREPLARIDYIVAVDTQDLNPVKEIVGGTLIALAVYIGKTRLIDNIMID
jgi:pantoate--beta-alanine ligase